MQKLESLLLDIAAKFFQGLMLIAAAAASYGLLVDGRAHSALVALLGLKRSAAGEGWLAAPEAGSDPVWRVCAAVAVSIAICCLVGLLLSPLAKWMFRRGPFRRSRPLCYKENIRLIERVKEKLQTEYEVVTTEIRHKMGWVPYYRWAAHLASTQGWRTPLHQYKLRCRMYGSLTCVFTIAVCWVLALQAVSLILQLLNGWSVNWLPFALLLAVFLAAACVSKRAYEDYYVRTGNEAMMILHTFFAPHKETNR
ncbi:hypothetical protein N0M98_13945 [Paenibacillus doosanensis]|uniref:Uncharacterized protein n=1 Tax=Paenibacillus konkukensis TaxID=2020716 RepID=A0ABY4RTG5_9BACL|nr:MULTISPECIES: hypothetical protein [Paenibacillus]MCS7461248.1 hypothetical protein [Paenibacillus doosanensis]UQZ85310.1 hypothetical protein SK3146_04599 [Paenibacillus konkukensis]